MQIKKFKNEGNSEEISPISETLKQISSIHHYLGQKQGFLDALEKIYSKNRKVIIYIFNDTIFSLDFETNLRKIPNHGKINFEKLSRNNEDIVQKKEALEMFKNAYSLDYQPNIFFLIKYKNISPIKMNSCHFFPTS